MAYLRQDLHTPEETRHWMRAIVFARQRVIVAESGGALVGFLALDGNLMSNLYLSPAQQSRGIGSALLAEAKGLRPGGLELWVFEPNTGAIRFYTRHRRAPRRSEQRGEDPGPPDGLAAAAGGRLQSRSSPQRSLTRERKLSDSGLVD